MALDVTQALDWNDGLAFTAVKGIEELESDTKESVDPNEEMLGLGWSYSPCILLPPNTPSRPLNLRLDSSLVIHQTRARFDRLAANWPSSVN